MNAINERRFVLEIDRLASGHRSRSLSSRTNFIILDGDKVTIQLEGIRGGVTVEGTPTRFKITTNKKGHLNLSMLVNTFSIKTVITMKVPKNSNRGFANVFGIRTRGLIYPLDKSTIYKRRVKPNIKAVF